QTLAKPISSRIKEQARQHERFRGMCIGLAQFMYRYEVRMRTSLLGEAPKHIRPLSEVKAIENGANALAEGFLFSVAAALIVGETWRSSRSQARRRDDVDEQLDALGARLGELAARVDASRGSSSMIGRRRGRGTWCIHVMGFHGGCVTMWLWAVCVVLGASSWSGSSSALWISARRGAPPRNYRRTRLQERRRGVKYSAVTHGTVGVIACRLA
ncbi:optic atrophy 3 protein-domain-containing protein, partial [Pholiota molesta]